MTRIEHIAWCKSRALEYVDRGDLTNAVASMGSDLTKHDETLGTASMLTMLGIYAIKDGPEAVRKWINGFN